MDQEEVYMRIGDELAEQGYAIVDGFLPEPVLKSLRGEVEGLLGQGALKEAGIGNSDAKVVEKSIRGDQIYWLEERKGNEESSTPTGLNFLQQVHLVREFLRRYLMLPLRGVEAHYAVYPKGTYYQRHLDQFQGESHRKLSFICYLNENWQLGNGGELIIYPEREAKVSERQATEKEAEVSEGKVPGAKAEVRVEPIGGRLVIFRSDLLEHEVLVTMVPRVGITGWMLDCEPDLRFLKG